MKRKSDEKNEKIGGKFPWGREVSDGVCVSNRIKQEKLFLQAPTRLRCYRKPILELRSHRLQLQKTDVTFFVALYF